MGILTSGKTCEKWTSDCKSEKSGTYSYKPIEIKLYSVLRCIRDQLRFPKWIGNMIRDNFRDIFRKCNEFL